MQVALVLDSRFVRRWKMLAVEFVKHEAFREPSQVRQPPTLAFEGAGSASQSKKIKLECGVRSAC